MSRQRQMKRRVLRLRLDRGDALVAVPERMQVLRFELGDEGACVVAAAAVSAIFGLLFQRARCHAANAGIQYTLLLAS